MLVALPSTSLVFTYKFVPLDDISRSFSRSDRPGRFPSFRQFVLVYLHACPPSTVLARWHATEVACKAPWTTEERNIRSYSMMLLS